MIYFRKRKRFKKRSKQKELTFRQRFTIVWTFSCAICCSIVVSGDLGCDVAAWCWCWPFVVSIPYTSSRKIRVQSYVRKCYKWKFKQNCTDIVCLPVVKCFIYWHFTGSCFHTSQKWLSVQDAHHQAGSRLCFSFKILHLWVCLIIVVIECT